MKLVFVRVTPQRAVKFDLILGLMHFLDIFEENLIELIREYFGWLLLVAFSRFDLKSFGLFEVHFRRTRMQSFGINGRAIVPEVNDPIEVVLSYEAILHEMLEFSDVATHEISLLLFRSFFFFRHLYYNWKKNGNLIKSNF